MDRRQPVYFSRLLEDAILGLEAEADYQGRDHSHARVPAAESLGAGGARVKVCVYGLWHLGSVTAACLAAAGHDVRGLDPDDGRIRDLTAGKPPIMEPGLAELVLEGRKAGRLKFFGDAREAIGGCALVWVTFDTPVDDDDRADTQYVIDRIS